MPCLVAIPFTAASGAIFTRGLVAHFTDQNTICNEHKKTVVDVLSNYIAAHHSERDRTRLTRLLDGKLANIDDDRINKTNINLATWVWNVLHPDNQQQ